MRALTLYEILEVAEDATPEMIKLAYRRLAMRWHPDRNLDNRIEAEAKFKEIGYAYKILSDQVSRSSYDEELERTRASANSYDEPAGHHESDGKFSEGDASQVFFEQMLDLAIELASRGFGAASIAKALMGLDCPELVAMQVADLASVKSSRRQGSNDEGTRKTTDTEGAGRSEFAEDRRPSRDANATQQDAVTNANSVEWQENEKFFAAALASPSVVKAWQSGENYPNHLSIIRGGVAVGIACPIFWFLYMNEPNDSDDLINGAVVSCLLGWAVMYCLFALMKSHRLFVERERLETYMPKFKNICLAGKSGLALSSGWLFPVPWFGYYGLLWPLVLLAIIFLSVDFWILASVSPDDLRQQKLIELSQQINNPFVRLVTWSILAAGFTSLLYRRLRVSIFNLKAYCHETALEQEIWRRHRPKLWRAVLATLLFVGANAIPGMVLPEKQVVLEAAAEAKKLRPDLLFRKATEILKRDDGNSKVAVIYLTGAAERKHADSERVLGALYGQGLYVAQDREKAIALLKSATDHGSAEAPALLHAYFADGRNGFPIDLKQSVAYARIAAERGHPAAQVSMGWFYMLGVGGLATDFQKAVFWNNKGAEGGDREGLNNLGWLYEHGLGVAQDFREASIAYTRSAEAGSTEASSRLQKLEFRLQSGQTSTQKSISEMQAELIIDGLIWNSPHLFNETGDLRSWVPDEVGRGQQEYIRKGYGRVEALYLATLDASRKGLMEK